MRSVKARATALATAVAATVAAAATSAAGVPAAHAPGSYTVFLTQPSIYQTNWTYVSDTVDSLAGTPDTATIAQVGYAYSLSVRSADLIVELCDRQRCVSLPGGDASGELHTFDGDPAVNAWHFAFRVNAERTKPLSPPMVSGRHRVTVTYT